MIKVGLTNETPVLSRCSINIFFPLIRSSSFISNTELKYVTIILKILYREMSHQRGNNPEHMRKKEPYIE